jgi:hypothetical protein
MVFRLLPFCLCLFSAISFAQGRKPAVEDFVGIEVEETKATPQGSETLYNLEQDISRIESRKNSPRKQDELKSPAPQGWIARTILGLSLALGLPLSVWFILMSRLKKKASLESASNIEVLEKYRKEREKKNEENIRKVS